MGDRKAKDEEKKSRKRSSSLSDSEDEEIRRKRRRKEKSRKSDGKEKRKEKKSHKHRSDKEKKLKDKHRAKHNKGDKLADFQELSNDDYFLKNNEFATWLQEKKKVFFNNLSSESARELFSEFVKDWNNQKLDSHFYEGILSGPRCAHSWKFKT